MDRPRRSRRPTTSSRRRPGAERPHPRDRAAARPRRYAPRRRSPVGIIVAVVLAAVVIGAGVTLMRSKDEATLKDTMAEVQRNMAEVLREVAADPASASNNQAGHLEDQARLLQERSHSVSGRSAKILRAMASFFRDEAVILRRYETAYAAFMEAGGMAPDGLDSLGGISKRRRLVAGLRSANAKLMKFFDGMTGVLAGHLDHEGLDSASRAEIMRGALKSMGGRLEATRAIRSMDDELCDLIDEMLNLLESQLGMWEIELGMVRFESDTAVETYNELVEEVQKVADRQLAAQRNLARKLLQSR